MMHGNRESEEGYSPDDLATTCRAKRSAAGKVGVYLGTTLCNAFCVAFSLTYMMESRE